MLLKFLLSEWKKNTYATILHGHELYFGINQECYVLCEDNGIVSCEIVPQLSCQHEEADTRIVWHLSNIASSYANTPNAVVRRNHPDILVILLYHASTLQANIWIYVGLSGKNTRRYIKVSVQAANLGNNILCDALPSLHAFTGSDFPSSFLRKGKVRPFDIMAKSPRILEAFQKLGSSKDTIEGGGVEF